MAKVIAERTGIRIVKAPRQLEQFPLSGRIVPEFRESNIRELIYGSYRIIYILQTYICYIVSVVHAGRDILQHLETGEWDVTVL